MALAKALMVIQRRKKSAKGVRRAITRQGEKVKEFLSVTKSTTSLVAKTDEAEKNKIGNWELQESPGTNDERVSQRNENRVQESAS